MNRAARSAATYAYLREWATALIAEADGDRQGALHLLLGLSRQPRPMVRPAGYWHITATAMLCRGLVDNDPDLVDTAGDEFAHSGRPLSQAYARECAAVMLARAHRTGEARHALSAAVKLYGMLDAGRDSARAVSRLQRHGVRHLPYAPRRRARAGWDAITETEWRVAGLVAEGLSNPEIGQRMHISRRTVQCHVSNILTKLSLGSRVQLAIAVAQRTGPGSDGS